MPSLVETVQVVLKKEDFKNFVDVFSEPRNYLSLVKGVALQLNKLEFPSPKDALRQVWLKYWLSGSVEEDSFNFMNVFSLFNYHLPLEKGKALL